MYCSEDVRLTQSSSVKSISKYDYNGINLSDFAGTRVMLLKSEAT